MWDENKYRKNFFECLEIYKTQKNMENALAKCLEAAESLEHEYLPLWFYKNNVLSGSVVNVTKGVEGDFPKAQAFEDILFLVRIIHDLRSMEGSVSSALVVLPFYMSTFNDAMLSELAQVFLRYVEENFKKRVIFLVRNYDAASMQKKIQLSVLKKSARALILDTNYQKAPPEDYKGFHAYGCDMYGQTFTEDQLFLLLNKYASYYEGQNQKTVLTGIDTKSILMAAVAAGFTYLSGKAVAKPCKDLNEASYLTVEDIYVDQPKKAQKV